jgi:hypothetical protein
VALADFQKNLSTRKEESFPCCLKKLSANIKAVELKGQSHQIMYLGDF